MKFESIIKLVDKRYNDKKLKRHSIPSHQMKLVYNWIRMVGKVKDIIEVGTCLGRMSYFLSIIAKEHGGTVHTIDIKKDRVEFARKTLSDVDNIKFYEGDSLEILPKIIDDVEFNVVIVDGKHDFTHSHGEYEMCNNRMNDGIIIFHDASAPLAEGLHDGGVPRAMKEIDGVKVHGNMAYLLKEQDDGK